MDEKNRVIKLKTKIKSLRKSNQGVLFMLIQHLQKILDHAETNKMAMSNLTYTFAPILFASHVDASESTNTGGGALGWFTKQNSQIMTPEIQTIENLKADLTLSDLIAFKDELFASEGEDKLGEEPIEADLITRGEGLNDSMDRSSIRPVVDFGMESASASQDISIRSMAPALPSRSSISKSSYVTESSPCTPKMSPQSNLDIKEEELEEIKGIKDNQTEELLLL